MKGGSKGVKKEIYADSELRSNSREVYTLYKYA